MENKVGQKTPLHINSSDTNKVQDNKSKNGKALKNVKAFHRQKRTGAKIRFLHVHQHVRFSWKGSGSQ